MASYYLAPALKALRAEVDRRWPYRDRKSDGWIGDTSHSARKSDHNPDYSSGGVVRALDIDKDGIDTAFVLSALVKDFRVNYVIWNGKIYQRIHGFAPRTYSGSNAHTQHMHVSIRHGGAYENSTWGWLDKGLPGIDSGSGFQAGSPTGGVNLPGLDGVNIGKINHPHAPAEDDDMFMIRIGISANKAELGKVFVCRFGNKETALFKHISPAEFEALARGGVELRLVSDPKVSGGRRDFSEHEKNLMRAAIIQLRDSWKVN